MRILIKYAVTSALIVAISEAAKRSSWLAAILASLPLTSILALCWLYWDTGSTEKVAELSTGILWAVFPSLLFFVALPFLLKSGMHFGWAMLLACATMSGAYGVFTWVTR